MTDSISIADPELSLDVLLTQAAGMWRRWRSDHPRPDDSDVGVDSADKCDGFKFVHSVVPSERSSLLRIADDDRIWGHEGEDPDAVTVEAVVRDAIEFFLDEECLHLDRCWYPHSPGEAIDDILLGVQVRWKQWRREHPNAPSGVSYTDAYGPAEEAADVAHKERIFGFFTPRSQDALLAIAADPRVWNTAAFAGEGNPGAHITAVLRRLMEAAMDAVDRS